MVPIKITTTLFICLLLPTFSSLSVAADSFDWSAFNLLLSQHVKPGSKQEISVNLVDYTKLKESMAFTQIALDLDSYKPQFNSNKDKISFYINAYNYFAIKMVNDHYPVNSIKDIGNFLFPVWKKTAGKIGGENVSLDYIEHDVLRRLGDPRIHFAIVCASLSCPDLRTEAYSSDTIDQQLNEQTLRYLSQSKGVLIKSDQLKISKIFDWFESDFSTQGGVLAFLSSYQPELKSYTSFQLLDYNWSLNDQAQR